MKSLPALFRIGLLTAFALTTGCSREPENELQSLPGVEIVNDAYGSIDRFAQIAVERSEEFLQAYSVADGQEAKAVSLARLAVAFKRELVSRDESVELFDFDEQDIVRCFEGTEGLISPGAAFGDFAGKWQGTWEDFQVQHHWSDLITPQIDQLTGSYSIQPYQYAWVGDGYGVNVVATKPEAGHQTRSFIFGYVEHISREDTNQVKARRPHVGGLLDRGQLIWITGGECFFEQMVPGEVPHYSIIGFEYKSNDDSFWITRSFQTKYFRGENDSAKFKELETGKIQVHRMPL